MKKISWVFVCILSLCLVGCKDWREIPVGILESSKHGFSTQVDKIGWMQHGRTPYFLMTKDGIALQYIGVSRAEMNGKLEHTKKRFLFGMSPSEISEVDLDDIRSREQVGKFILNSQEPRSIAGHSGYQFFYEYVTREGLRVLGQHVGFAHEDRVYRIQFEAAAQHYFKAYQPDFEAFLSHFKVL